jgi:hypothetical protein
MLMSVSQVAQTERRSNCWFIRAGKLLNEARCTRVGEGFRFEHHPVDMYAWMEVELDTIIRLRSDYLTNQFISLPASHLNPRKELKTVAKDIYDVALCR